MSNSAMRLKPVRFVGHKLGPFDHIELDWEKESRYTLIVAENGLGKTTLITAIAACLAGGNVRLLPNPFFYRLAHDNTAYAYLELDIEGEIGAIIRKASEEPETSSPLHPYLLSKDPSKSPFRLEHMVGQTVMMTRNLERLRNTWFTAKDIRALGAAYGIYRDISHPEISEYRELVSNPLQDLLNPFAPLASAEIFQWITNRHIDWALALVDHREEEAKSYLAAIERIEQLMKEMLGMSISFHVKRNPLRLEVRQNESLLSVDLLSDGTRNLIGWLFDYLMRASRVNWVDPTDSANPHGLILIDEIDSHLHPEWQRRIMSMVNQLLPNTYIIATTHSPFVLGAADEAQVFRIYKDEQGKLQATSSFDEFYGQPADRILKEEFVPSLYPPEIEQKRERLSELAGKLTFNLASPDEKAEHDALLKELAEVDPWLQTLLALSKNNPS